MFTPGQYPRRHGRPVGCAAHAPAAVAPVAGAEPRRRGRVGSHRLGVNPAALRRDAPSGAVARLVRARRRVRSVGARSDRRGRSARWPDLEQMARLRTTRVVLAAAHLDHDPGNNRLRNLRGLCQRCHLIHDRPHHLAQRRITYLLRRASGDLFLGPYGVSLIQCRKS